MPQGIDDFTIVFPQFSVMGACELNVYSGLDQLWRMVERYKMTALSQSESLIIKTDTFGQLAAISITLLAGN